MDEDEFRELQIDAARYRFIRDIPVYDTALAVAEIWPKSHKPGEYKIKGGPIQGSLLDKRVDKEMREYEEIRAADS